MEKVIRIESRESSGVKSYRDLLVWQKSMALVTFIYQAVACFPKEEIYGLTSQIKRSAISIPSNIAEGSSRRSTAEFIRFINIATGSLAELETQFAVAANLNFITDEMLQAMMKKADELSRMLQGLHTALLKKLDS